MANGAEDKPCKSNNIGDTKTRKRWVILEVQFLVDNYHIPWAIATSRGSGEHR